MSKKPEQTSSNIAQNKKARHDYFIEDTYEAGLVLQGWEVKSLRAGRVTIVEAYVLLKNGEAFLIGATITPLLSTSNHYVPEATRTRKLLLNRRELNRMIGAVQQKRLYLRAVIVLLEKWHGEVPNWFGQR